MKFSEEQQMALASGNCARGSKLITGTAAEFFPIAQNESIVKNLLKNHPDNGMIRRIAEIMGLIPDSRSLEDYKKYNIVPLYLRTK